MKLEDQVTSLELSKRLKELGVKQESLLWWIEWGDDIEVCDEEYIEFHEKSDYPRVVFCHTCKPELGVPPKSNIVSAFTASELGEMLPDRAINQDDNKSVYPYDFVSWPTKCPMNKWKGSVSKVYDTSYHALQLLTQR